MTKIEELVAATEALDRTEFGSDVSSTVISVADAALNALPELRALRWIPVEERMPDTDREVEISVDVGEGEDERCLGFYSVGAVWMEIAMNGWLIEIEGATHWREKTPGPGGGS